MELIKELLIVGGRIVTIMPLMLGVTFYMGKRSIGELPVFDFLIIITFGAVVGADIADPAIPHIHTAVAIVLIGILQIIVSKLIIKYRKLGHVITFEPTIVVVDGKLIKSNLKRLRYSIDNVLQMIREQGMFDIKDVYLGIIEANGKLSILKQPSKENITIEDMKLEKKNSSLSYPVIIDGKVYEDVLAKLELSNDWLHEELRKLDVKNLDEVFFASVNIKKELHVSLENYMKDKRSIPPIYN
ncbi:DUF421 domain-containing protein [Clostridium beijerinckii]|uniref:DUF421 domain-containing protein n=1 Tax=Clostridium beijerinckii TaxID=1520 RepID=UPI0024312879|nr:DUF421 domain-containing protein [Clostridium beijerinckii]MDG5853761.1 DUF421 domain-containing protein [Clostridium beijerinckii]